MKLVFEETSFYKFIELMSVAISQISVLLQKVLSFNLVGFVYLFEKYAVRLTTVSRKFLKSSVLISLF